MTIRFDLWWVDDSSDWLESRGAQFDELCERIRGHGFEPNIRKFTDIPALDYNGRCSLLVVDLNLDETIDGADVIRQFQKNRPVEAVFYTNGARRDLAAAAAERELEGVFYSARGSVFDRVGEVFELVVSKAVDTDNMRGLVMLGVARLESAIGEILTTKFPKLAEGKRAEFVSSVVRKLNRKSKDATTAAERVKDKTTWSEVGPVVRGMDLDASKRCELLAKLVEEHDYLQAYAGGIAELGHLLAWRNALAHQEVTEREGKHYFSVMRKEMEWNEAVAKGLRLDIARISKLLIECKSAVETKK